MARYTGQERLASKVSKLANGYVTWIKNLNGTIDVYNGNKNIVWTIGADQTISARGGRNSDGTPNPLTSAKSIFADGVIAKAERWNAKHVTHTGEVISGARLTKARNKVAGDWAALAHAIRRDDDYADHVTTKQKDENLAQMLAEATDIRAGKHYGFTIWQRINTELTGECIALLK